MKKKYLLEVAFFAVLCFAVNAQNASDFQTSTENGTITITGYTGSAKNVVIPERVDGMPVVAVANEAFRSKGLTSVVIANGVRTIGASAFAFNPLTNIQLPDSVTTIGSRAFYYQVIENSVNLGDWNYVMGNTIDLLIGSNVDLAVDSFNLDFYALYDKMSKAKGRYKLERLRWKTESNQMFSDFLVGFSWDGNGTITIWGRTGTAREVVIPATMAGIPVTHILTKSVITSDVTSIIIPNSIISIEEGLPMASSRDTSFRSFITAYNQAGKRAGRYTKAGNTWNFSER